MIVTKHGKVVLHKAKRNNNLSFSKGKTWNLEDMRALEVIGVSSPFFPAGALSVLALTILEGRLILAYRLCFDYDAASISLANGESSRSSSFP